MKVLVVDDDAQLSSILGFVLRHEGLAVVTAADGVEGIEAWEREQPDLVLLDVNLPRLDGYSVLRRIRSSSKTPVIMLTVRSDDDDVVTGLDIGADDYIAKPFSPKTLLARIRAVLRRGSAALPEGDVTIGDLFLDADRQELAIKGREPIHLTPLEFRLLQHLMLHQGQVIGHENLIEHVWGYDGSGDRDMLKQLVRRIRRKIETDASAPEHIETVANVGYSFHPG